MKATIYILSILTLILGGVAVALGLQPTLGQTDSKKNINRYGLHEGLELVGRVDGKGYETFAVVDENDRLLFAIPLRNCMFDVRYRNGQLRFRENGTGREGFVDRNGNVTFFSTGTGIPSTVEQEESSTMAQAPGQSTYEGGQNSGKADKSGSMTDGDLKQMARSNPFYKEAAKILIQHFMLFSDEKITLETSEQETNQEFDEEVLHMRQLLKTKLVDMNLSVRALNCLKAADVETLGDLVQFNKTDLLKFRNFGKKSLSELDDLLESLNLSFGTDISKYKLDKDN